MSIDLTGFFDRLRGSFSATRRITQQQVDGLDFLLPRLAAFDSLYLEDVAYILATTAHETGWTFQPIQEWGSDDYFASRYDPELATTQRRRQRAIRMGNTKRGDGARYCGRGYVQLTWKNNYLRAGDHIGVDLVANPDAAMEPENAIQILVLGMSQGWFTGRKLRDYIEPPRIDFYHARRMINGMDRAKQIAGYADKFLRIVSATTRQAA